MVQGLSVTPWEVCPLVHNTTTKHRLADRLP